MWSLVTLCSKNSSNGLISLLFHQFSSAVGPALLRRYDVLYQKLTFKVWRRTFGTKLVVMRDSILRPRRQDEQTVSTLLFVEIKGQRARIRDVRVGEGRCQSLRLVEIGYCVVLDIMRSASVPVVTSGRSGVNL